MARGIALVDLYNPNTSSDDESGDKALVPETQIDADEAPVDANEAPGATFILPVLAEGQEFRTEKEGFDAINDFALLHGYAVSTLRTKCSKKGIKNKIILCCTRGREFRRRSSKQIRQTTTQAINCPFSLLLRLNLDTQTWHLEVKNRAHNHPAAPATTQTIHRVRERNNKQEIIEIGLKQGLKTNQILTGLRQQDPTSCILAQDIHNLRKKLNPSPKKAAPPKKAATKRSAAASPKKPATAAKKRITKKKATPEDDEDM